MPAYNFQARFAPAVLSGAKLCTIRRREAKVGSIAYLFTGMRTNACKRLNQGEIVSCEAFELCRSADGTPRVALNWLIMGQTCADALAIADGFDDVRSMLGWFQSTYGERRCSTDGSYLVFEGFLVTWVPEK